MPACRCPLIWMVHLISVLCHNDDEFSANSQFIHVSISDSHHDTVLDLCNRTNAMIVSVK